MRTENKQNVSGGDEHDPELTRAPLSDLGKRVRAARKAKKLTLQQLAEVVGCSASMISKIETEQATPSLPTLHRILSALDTSIVHLFTDDPPTDTLSVMRSGARPSVVVRREANAPTIHLERISPSFPGLMLDANIHNLEPGAESGGDIRHAGQEVGYVLQGAFELIVSEQSYHLQTGDSFYFASELPHRYRNTANVVTRVLWVSTPLTF